MQSGNNSSLRVIKEPLQITNGPESAERTSGHATWPPAYHALEMADRGQTLGSAQRRGTPGTVRTRHTVFEHNQRVQDQRVPWTIAAVLLIMCGGAVRESDLYNGNIMERCFVSAWHRSRTSLFSVCVERALDNARFKSLSLTAPVSASLSQYQ